jgi:hypothetical protein
VPPTATHLLIEARLGRDLKEFVAERQNAGEGWRRIAEDIYRRTNVSVSHEALRSWCGKRAA